MPIIERVSRAQPKSGGKQVPVAALEKVDRSLSAEELGEGELVFAHDGLPVECWRAIVDALLSVIGKNRRTFAEAVHGIIDTNLCIIVLT